MPEIKGELCVLGMNTARRNCSLPGLVVSLGFAFAVQHLMLLDVLFWRHLLSYKMPAGQ